MTNSFLILFITIKAKIALILQGVSINTHSVMTEKKVPYTSLILSDHHSHIHTSFFISLEKNILKEVEKKEENILYTLSFSHYHRHRHLASLSLLEKQTQNITKGSKNKKEKRKGEEILKIF